MSTKLTALKKISVLYGRDPPPLARLGREQSSVGSLEEMIKERDANLFELHCNLTRDTTYHEASGRF